MLALLSSTLIYEIIVFLFVMMPVGVKYENIQMTAHITDIFIIVSTTCQNATFIPGILFILTIFIYLLIAILTKYTTSIFN